MARQARGYWIEPRTRSGIWQICWTESRRKITRSLGTRDAEDAELQFERFLAELDRPEQPEEPTVASVIDGYIAERQEARSIRVMKIHAEHVKRHLGWLTVGALRPSHARSYAVARRKAGIMTGTIRQELVSLRAALKWAQGERIVDLIPAVPFPNAPAPRSRWLTRDEAAALVAGAVAAHIRLFIQIALGTGARSGAILSLKWKSVDLDRRVIDFGHGYGGKRNAVVPIHATLAAALVEARTAAQTGNVIEFCGKPVARIMYGVRKAVERAGIAHCTPHDLRRTAGSWMLQRGVSIEVVSRMLGHTSKATTERVYAHHTVEFLRAASNALEG